jgi:hypothetical protein
MVGGSAQQAVTLDFRNHIPGLLDAPVFDMDGVTRLEGGRFCAQLYYGPGGTPEGSLVAVSFPSGFQTGTNAGYWQPKQVTLPGVVPGDPISVQVRVWEIIPIMWPPDRDSSGARVKSQVLSLVVTNPPTPLVGLQSMSLQPESLFIKRQDGQVIVGWLHLGASFYALDASVNPAATNSWSTVFNFGNMQGLATTLSVTNPIAGPQQFYRLERWR